MPQLIQNLIRLDASSYHGATFLQDERLMAQHLGLNYYKSLDEFQKSHSSKESGHALISNTHTLPEDLPVQLLNQTRLWIHSNSGYDNFSATFVEAANFPIVTGNSIRSAAVSEYILAQTFEHFGLKKHQQSWDRSRSWPRQLIKEQNVLICGEGLIGSTLKSCLTPLSKEIFTYDPYKYSEQKENLTQFLCKLPKIDILILSCSLNSSSRQLINKEVLELLDDDFLLINAARGALIDESALLKTLKVKTGAFATLDVFESEPTPDHYSDLQNLKRTSHIAGVSENIDELIISFENKVLEYFLTSELEFSKKYEKDLLSNRIDKIKKELI